MQCDLPPEVPWLGTYAAHAHVSLPSRDSKCLQVIFSWAFSIHLLFPHPLEAVSISWKTDGLLGVVNSNQRAVKETEGRVAYQLMHGGLWGPFAGNKGGILKPDRYCVEKEEKTEKMERASVVGSVQCTDYVLIYHVGCLFILLTTLGQAHNRPCLTAASTSLTMAEQLGPGHKARQRLDWKGSINRP